MRKIHISLLLKVSKYSLLRYPAFTFAFTNWIWCSFKSIVEIGSDMQLLLKKELFAAKVEKAFFSTMYGSSLRKLLKENCPFLLRLDFLTLLHSFSLYVFFPMHFWGSYCSVLPVIQYFLAKVNSWVHEHRFINCSKKGNLYDMIFFFLLISFSENTEFL